MAQDTIDAIRAAEERAQAARDQASREAAAMVSEAQKKAKSQYDEAIAAARSAADDALDTSKDDGDRLLKSETARYTEECARLQESVAGLKEKAIEAVIRELI